MIYTSFYIMVNTKEWELSLETLKQYYAFRRAFDDLKKYQRDEAADIIEGLAYAPTGMYKECIQYARLHYWLAQHYNKEGNLEKANQEYRLALHSVENAGLNLSMRKWVKVEERGYNSDTKLVDGEELKDFITNIFKSTR